jgi:sugar/nucleoside kinase (ribokinase family)
MVIQSHMANTTQNWSKEVSTNSNFDVIVVGDYCLDFIFTGLPSLPIMGSEIISDHFIQTSGGTCNSVIAMHRLGLKVGWAADFGNDQYSKFILERIVTEGIDPSLFVHHDFPLRKITVSLSYTQDRSFIAFYDPDPRIPAGMKLLPKYKPRMVYVPGIYLGFGASSYLNLMKVKGIKVCMDGNSSEIYTLKNHRILKILSRLDLFFANKKELLQLTGIEDLQAAVHELGKIIPLVVIKDGANGAYAIENEKVYYCPALKIKVKDTTGAGDCFNAGFIKSWLNGASIHECLSWGNIVGGLSTTELGGTGKVVRVQEVEKYLSHYKRGIR